METNNRAIVVGIVVILVVALGAGIYYSRQDNDDAGLPEDRLSESEEVLIDTADSAILVQHTYIDGVHTFTGVLEVPTPCHEIKTDVLVMESFPEQVSVKLTIVPPPADTICIQVIAEKEFKVSYRASETAVGDNLRVMLDGKPIIFIIGGKD
ncbi:MAG: hypothetical protein COV07_01045 [Candidatus Vogelbacteria bacterium CG10_big_fil_rev_8_21_14_0_10_45_14]|uniref:Uncharacterized protein n=1 Tax=Candidatus Vogelbacteria bacterium CG10_big_fil_rev_8_21_14_0_10_45_14 TaxID=1975042 RepID=A0A2H0RKL0_9BACT|nr:MAG: hypothetical protein COV07_01045 [Candidatus Vogelbacteria bacterium CG10_big_fil_rev_8_21_14_0_10_45_14]